MRMRRVRVMTTCKVKRWDLVETDIRSLGEEIENSCNVQEVLSVETFIFGRWLVLIAIFKK
jgi:hypothetical protein